MTKKEAIENHQQSAQCEQERKDLLIIVPNQFLDRYKRVIKHTIWATGSEKTCDVLSGDQFHRLYGDKPVEVVVRELRARWREVGHIGDLSRREQAAYDKIMGTCILYVKVNKELAQ